MRNRTWGGLIVAAAAGGVLLGTARVSAQASKLDFEEGLQGFNAIQLKDGQPSPDTVSTLEVSHEKDVVKSGKGSLSYSFNVEPKVLRLLNADLRAPEGTKSVRFWARSKTPTALIFSLREDNGVGYPLSFYLPAYEWTQVSANLDELNAEGEGATDKRLNPAHLAGISVMDVAEMFVNAPADAPVNLGSVQGSRQLWLDDIQFSSERVSAGTGPVKGGAFLVDDFENGTIRWSAVKVQVENGAPNITIFPSDATLKVEEIAPVKSQLERGGKALHYSYTRAAQTVFAVNRQVPGARLEGMERLKLSLNLSQKSLVLVQVKKKNGAEYNQTIMPDDSTGWHDLDLPLSGFTIGDNSKDPDGKLNPTDIKELTILDASGFLGGMLPGGPTTMDVDAIYFSK